MKAISLWQPWATLVAIGAKQYETRSWYWRYRGPLAIHAAKRFDPNIRDLCMTDPFRRTLKAAGLDPMDLPLGMIVCTCQVVRCELTEAVRPTISDLERAFGDYRPGRFAAKLDNVRRLEVPSPWRGAQGFFDWHPASLEESMRIPENIINAPIQHATATQAMQMGIDWGHRDGDRSVSKGGRQV